MFLFALELPAGVLLEVIIEAWIGIMLVHRSNQHSVIGYILGFGLPE
jgi:hypothetical protein